MNAPIKVLCERYQGYLVLVLLMLVFQAVSVRENQERILARAPTVDYDGYWHLLRVQEIHRTGSWDNEINPRGNAPLGERLHWTHAMDLVLWAGATIGSLSTDFDTSLFWWGVAVGPVLYALSLLAVILLGRVLLGPQYLRLPAFLFLCSIPQLFIVYSVNRPDHHCLVALAYILYYSLFLVLLERPQSTAPAVWAGVLGALGLWCGLELSVLVGLSMLYLGLLWILDGRKYLKANSLLALTLSVSLLVIVLLDERPGRYREMAYDRVSLVHAGIFFLVFLFWRCEGLLGRAGLSTAFRSRLSLAFGGAIPMVFLSQALFPRFLHGPMAEVDPRLYGLYLHRTGEFATMIRYSSLSHLGYSVLLVAPALLYLVWAAYRNEGNRRVLFVWLALTLGVYLALALTMERWLYTLAFSSIVPTAFALIALWKWAAVRRRPLAALAATLGLLFAPYLALVLLPHSEDCGVGASKTYDLKLMSLLSFLRSQPDVAPGGVMLANIWIGPAIMYHTSLSAVGTPNHSNSAGIIDTYRIVNASEDAAAQQLIQTRGISYLLVDDKLKKFAAYDIDAARAAEGRRAEATFLGRLGLGRLPPWLTPIPVPEELADTFTLYGVGTGETRCK